MQRDPALEQKAIDLALEGRSIKRIQEILEVSASYFWHYRKEHIPFSSNFAHALEEGNHRQVDRLLEITEEIEDVNKARLISDNIKWTAARKLPHIYGDRLDINVTHMVDISGALQAAKRRAASVRELPENPEIQKLENPQTPEILVATQKNATGFEPVAAENLENSDCNALQEYPENRRKQAKAALPQRNAGDCNALPPQRATTQINANSLRTADKISDSENNALTDIGDWSSIFS